MGSRNRGIYMKKFIIAACVIVLLFLIADNAYYRLGWYIDFEPSAPVTTFVKTDGKQICMEGKDGYEPFEIKGVDLGSDKPGEWASDYAIDYDTYKRWFARIQELGANTIRVYTIQDDVFYNAFYDYNSDNTDPLWLIQGVWVNDYYRNSHRDAYDSDFYDNFVNDCRTMLDVIHGNKKIAVGRVASAGSGTYLKDVSPWTIGYILGSEWDDVTVAYTDKKFQDSDEYRGFSGEYLYTSEDATAFETMLARVGDKLLEYESNRYKMQKLISFSNWPTTDPFDYPDAVTEYFMKCAKIDTEHIKSTDKVISGQFASYHVYPYYPDYLNYFDDWTSLGAGSREDYLTGNGNPNTYLAYLTMLNKHHDMPVVISEFGISSGRGMEHRDNNTGRNQGNMSERQQGEAIVSCYEDIIASGCCGCCVFSWHDEWAKNTPNTMYCVNLRRTPYWSDYQTNGQFFGLLSFDPGWEKPACYADGDVSEWGGSDIVMTGENTTLAVRYDEKFLYFWVHKEGLEDSDEPIYIPIDTTPKSGSSYCRNYNLLFDRAADFIIVLDGKDKSRVQVQKRYEAIRSTYSREVYGFDAYYKGHIPDKDDPDFVNIKMIENVNTFSDDPDAKLPAETFETGKLVFGNSSPESEDYNSLADYMISGDDAEIRLPWQLLNFSDPSRMEIHDDYYLNYGIEYLNIDTLWAGIAQAGTPGRTELHPFRLYGWGNDVSYHERLKPAYYSLQKIWSDADEG